MSTKRSPRPAVLVADDDPGIRRYFKMALDYFGFRVRTCTSGTAALRLAKTGKYALVLLDYWMGVPNGFEVLMRLRKDGLKTPVILISSGFPEHIREHCATERLAYVLGKPFTLEILRKTIALALEDGRP